MSLNIDKTAVTVALLAYHESFVDCTNFKEFHFGDPPTDEQVSVNTLMEELKPIVVEK